MGQRMKWRDAAPKLGITQHALYELISQGVVPALRLGAPGKRGRLVIDLDLAEEAIRDKMMENTRRPEPEQPYTRVRRVK